MSELHQPSAESEASSSTHVVIASENTKASRPESVETQPHSPPQRASSRTPSLNLEAGTGEDKESWLDNKRRRIQTSWPNTSRTVGRIYRFFRGPSPPVRMPVPGMLYPLWILDALA